MAKVNVSIPDGLLDEVDDLAKDVHRSRSGFIQEATAHYVAHVKEARAKEERRRSIEAGMRGMRDLSSAVAPGTDTTQLIREDRDSDHGGTDRG